MTPINPPSPRGPKPLDADLTPPPRTDATSADPMPMGTAGGRSSADDLRLPSPQTETAESSQFVPAGSRSDRGMTTPGRSGDRAAQAAGEAKDQAGRAVREAGQAARQATGQATDAAKQAVGDAKQTAVQTYEQGKQKAVQFKDQAVTQTRQAADQVKTQAAGLVAGQAHRAADEVDGFARAIRRAVDTLRDEDDNRIAEYAEQAAVGVESVRDYLRDADVSRMARDAGAFVRQRPEWALGGLFVAGLAVGRFLKASRPEGRPAGRDDRFDVRYPEDRHAADDYFGDRNAQDRYADDFGRSRDFDEYGDAGTGMGMGIGTGVGTGYDAPSPSPSPFATSPLGSPKPATSGYAGAPMPVGVADDRADDGLDLGTGADDEEEIDAIDNGMADPLDPTQTTPMTGRGSAVAGTTVTTAGPSGSSEPTRVGSGVIAPGDDAADFGVSVKKQPKGEVH